MAYSTKADLELRCGGADGLRALADHDGDGFADQVVWEQAIVDADALINQHAAKQFTVPFTAPSAGVVALSARLAVYFLRSWRGTLTPEDVRAHEADVRLLEGMSEGRLLPDQDPVPAKHSIRRDAVTDRPTSKDVGRRKMGGFS